MFLQQNMSVHDRSQERENELYIHIGTARDGRLRLNTDSRSRFDSWQVGDVALLSPAISVKLCSSVHGLGNGISR